MPSQPRVDPKCGNSLTYCDLQRLIEPAQKRLLRMTTASVNRDYVITARQQFQASWFIKPVTR
ncbi:hypothetical protein BDI4_1080041 [Burkholderia diffusa]|nr:hypothetical protein BDI4_1080041 [Burkholderia diffusa]